jgi:hypothetical protein
MHEIDQVLSRIKEINTLLITMRMKSQGFKSDDIKKYNDLALELQQLKKLLPPDNIKIDNI